jgi:hypothetical protein
METNFNREDVSQEEFLTPKEELLLDKYRITLNILQKESDLIENYDYLLKEMKLGIFDIKGLHKTYIFLDCWVSLSEIYHFLEFNKIADMKKDYKEDVEKLQEIMRRYEDFKGEISFDDLRQSYNLIRKFISIAGYHEDIDKLAGSGSISSFQQKKKKKPTEEWDG